MRKSGRRHHALTGLLVVAGILPACDFGDLGLGSESSGTGVSVVETGRRVVLASDADFEFCPGNLARWSADLDRIDSLLGLELEPELTRLTLLSDTSQIMDTCENPDGCYLRRPEGPESVTSTMSNDGRMIPYFVHDRLELGWSTNLPPFIEVGLGEALTGRTCTTGQASLESLLARGRGELLTSQERRAAGQWVRALLEHAGAEKLEEFASKLEVASSEGYIRSVFAEVYGVPIDLTWDDALSQSVLAPPGGWCHEPALPMVDGRARLEERLDCGGPRTQHLADGRYRVAHRVELEAGQGLRVEGDWATPVVLGLRACDCASSTPSPVESGDIFEPGPGIWLLELWSPEPQSEAVVVDIEVVDAAQAAD